MKDLGAPALPVRFFLGRYFRTPKKDPTLRWGLKLLPETK
jgi:hypothetical protein